MPYDVRIMDAALSLPYEVWLVYEDEEDGEELIGATHEMYYASLLAADDELGRLLSSVSELAHVEFALGNIMAALEKNQQWLLHHEAATVMMRARAILKRLDSYNKKITE